MILVNLLAGLGVGEVGTFSFVFYFYFLCACVYTDCVLCSLEGVSVSSLYLLGCYFSASPLHTSILLIKKWNYPKIELFDWDIYIRMLQQNVL